MAIWINARSAIRTVEDAREKLGEKGFNKAISAAFNEAISIGRTEARKAVKEVYNMPQRYLSGINIMKATPSSLTAKLYASSIPIPMDAFSPKSQQNGKSFTISKKGKQKTKVLKRKRKGPGILTIKVLKDEGEVEVPGGFMIEGGKPRVFARGAYKSGSYGFVMRNKRVNSTGNDIPIKPLLSVTVHAAVINKKALARVQVRINDTLPAALVRNVARLMPG
jgi:vacuolar-type H+-ATPase subunit E/Vma4